MAQERGEPSPDIPEARGNPMKLHSALESHKGCPGEWASDLECAVCLQTCIHPVRLPCNHIFCYLCVKGAANLSKRCALCRQEIPVDYLNNPALVLRDDVAKADKALCEDGLQWFYEGRNGWWQYDERTSSELEEKFKQGIKTFELLIAGFLYVIDFENMIQIRRNDPTRRRRVKRDRSTIQKKGVAGLKIPHPGAEGNTREGCDGEESGEPAAVPANNNDTNRRPATSAPAPGPPNGVLAPEPPADTPPSPSDDNSSSSSSTPSSQEELAMHLAAVSLNSQRRPPPRRRRRADIPTYHRMRLLESPESSDSGWDG